MESYSSGLPGSKLTANITARSQSLTLNGVPVNLPAGRYPLQVDAEIMTGSYTGTGRTFGDLQRGLEQTTAASHRAGVVVHHPVTGAALNQLARLTQMNPMNYVRSAGVRDYLGSNYT